MSRNKVANSMKNSMKNGSVIHYLGGTTTQTPFENKFRKHDVTFVRYEKMRSLVPNGYKKISFTSKGNAILPKAIDKGYFCNGNFFDCFFPMNEKLKEKESHFWLDFCGMPKSNLMESLYYTFFDKDSEIQFKTLYITFFLNPRGCREAKEIFQGCTTIEERANALLDNIKKMSEDSNLTFEVFDTYLNASSPMAVLKIERRENIEDMAKTASIQNYVRLHKRGFTNKQIAVFWKAGIMQVAGFAASAKRMKLV